MEFRPTSNRIPECRHFEDKLEHVGTILDRTVSSSDPEAIVDQVSNLSSTKETVLFLGFLFLQTDSSFEEGIMEDLFRAEANPRIKHFKNSALEHHE